MLKAIFFLAFLEHLTDPSDSCYERIDLLLCVVKSKGGAYGAADAEPCHEWLCTVVTCAYGNAQAVEQRSHVQMMDVADIEADDGIFEL